jgi:hypothetical protein
MLVLIAIGVIFWAICGRLAYLSHRSDFTGMFPSLYTIDGYYRAFGILARRDGFESVLASVTSHHTTGQVKWVLMTALLGPIALAAEAACTGGFKHGFSKHTHAFDISEDTRAQIARYAAGGEV